MTADAGLPAPFVLEGSSWGGDDGNWSTFRLSLGTPAQTFDVLPFTSTSQIMVLSQSACDESDDAAAACPPSRGAGFNPGSISSAGFTSDTWDDIGDFPFPSIGGYSGPVQGDYGVDNATLFDPTTDTNVTLQNQIIGLYNTSELWVGGLGLGVIASSFTSNRSVPSLLSSMKSDNLIPSLSFGYQAGSSSQSLPSRLVIGGYDASAYTASNTTWYIAGNGAPLQVVVDGIFLNSNSSTVPVSNETNSASIDSSTPYLWLSAEGCTAIADELMLGYNETSGLYIANSTALNHVRAQDYVLAFTLNSNAPTDEYNDDDGVTINIPFSMFDMELTAPLGEDGTHYFPMKQLPDQSANAIILGRSFLQAVYLVVDWERHNFSFSQAQRSSGNSADIRTILPVTSTTTGPSTTATPPISPPASSEPAVSRDKHSAWEIGTIVGVAVGVCVMIALGIWIRWTIVRKNRMILAAGVEEIEQRVPPPPPKRKNMTGEEFTSTTHLNELPSNSVVSHAMSKEIHELPAEFTLPELEAGGVRTGGSTSASRLRDPSAPRIECTHPDFGVPLSMEMSWLSDTDEAK